MSFTWFPKSASSPPPPSPPPPPPSAGLVFRQIQCVAVPNTIATQCKVFMYGLSEAGEVWFKRDTGNVWVREPMEFDFGKQEGGR